MDDSLVEAGNVIRLSDIQERRLSRYEQFKSQDKERQSKAHPVSEPLH